LDSRQAFKVCAQVLDRVFLLDSVGE